ncbi:hypothetical protein JMJ77_0007699, partial [Colletotrichum scovillei]
SSVVSTSFDSCVAPSVSYHPKVPCRNRSSWLKSATNALETSSRRRLSRSSWGGTGSPQHRAAVAGDVQTTVVGSAKFRA